MPPRSPSNRPRPNAKKGIANKRAHRAELTRQAQARWKLEGARARHAYMRRIRSALEREGFRSTRFQWRHKGHAFGLIKDLGDKQIHVRVYEDGVVDAEIEIHKRYVQHLWSPRPSAHKEVQEIFRRHDIPIQFVNEHYLPQVGAARKRYPRARTKVSHVLAGAAGTMGIVGVYAARLVLKRMARRALLGRIS